jgi:hypothetical protein
LNAHGTNDVRQTEIHTAEKLLPENSSHELEIVSESLKLYKSPDIHQIPAELDHTGGTKLTDKLFHMCVKKLRYLGKKSKLHSQGN